MSENKGFTDVSELSAENAEKISFCKKAAKISDDFEMENTELKRQYIVSNIMIYNAIGSMIKESMGTFGTGYPFYALNSDLTGALPIIDEQLRFNDELYGKVDESVLPNWICSECLRVNHMAMPDLKKICNPCSHMDNPLKPRKIISRLPDLDMWMVCKKEDIKKTMKELETRLAKNGFTTSDVDPIKTIYELEEIVAKLKYGKMPDKNLPIDTHIIDSVSLYDLINRIPSTLYNSYKNDKKPFLPILPISLRKTWQHDDEAYNYVFDYLASFSEFNFDEDLQKLLNETRREIAKTYSLDQLYKFMMISGTEVSRRRFDNPKLRKIFDEKVESWKEL